jgi:hypothetical protein
MISFFDYYIRERERVDRERGWTERERGDEREREREREWKYSIESQKLNIANSQT